MTTALPKENPMPDLKKAPVPMDQAAKETFLAMYRETGLKNYSARMTGVHRNTVYNHIDKDKEFAADVAAAYEEYKEGLIAEAYRRGVKGVEEPLYYQGELTGDHVRKYSDRLLERLLEAHADGFGKKVAVEHQHKGGVLVVHSDVRSQEDWVAKHGGERALDVVAEQAALPVTDTPDAEDG